jgi:tetratricopeptide (TPR) repeat protein
MNYDHIEKLIVDLSQDPHDPEKNFKAALEYEKLNQTASAVSFYLRAAEYGIDTQPLIVYASLLKVAKCIDDQNNRLYTVSNCLLQAISFAPERKEAYFLLSQFFEKQGSWQEAYTWAKMGFSRAGGTEELPCFVGYYGEYCLLFQQAVSSWWIGRQDESISLLSLLSSLDMEKEYKDAVAGNLERLGIATI